MITIRKSLLLSFAQRNSTLVISFVSSLIIVRLLSPHEIGIFSIGAVIVSFSHVIRDMGVSNYLIQEKELSVERIRSAQTIMCITSFTIAALLISFSFWAGRFYDEPGVALTMQVLAISFLLLPFGAVTVALLTREMAFGHLFVIGISSSLAQALVAIFLAWAGFGFISLAWSAVAGTAISWLVSSLYRRPGQPWLPGTREWRRVFAAGTKLSSSSMFNEIGLGGPELITGRVLGFDAVAYFSRGFGAAMIVYRTLVESMQPVAISYFAGRSRSGQELGPNYLQAISYMSGVALPAFACLAVMAKPIVVLLYGRQWLDAVIPLQIVSCGLACLAVGTVAASVLIGSGEIGVNLRMQAVFQPFKVVLVFLGAIFLGLPGVAAGVAVGDACISICCFTIVNRLAKVSLGEFCQAMLPSFGIALATAVVSWIGLHLLLPGEKIVIQLSLTSLGAGIVWVTALFLTRHPISKELSKALISGAR